MMVMSPRETGESLPLAEVNWVGIESAFEANICKNSKWCLAPVAF